LLPETLFRPELSIAAISRLVVGGPAPPPVEASPPPAGPDYTSLDYGSWTPAQRRILALARGVARLLTKQDVAGLDRVPASGAVIFAVNHLHILDALWAFTVLPRRTVFVVASEFRRRPLVGTLLGIGQAIFVARGASDRDALRRAADVLRGGGAVGIAPEGRLSRTGGLIPGQPGVAKLAADAAAPIVPIAMSGQERLWRCWLRGRRVPIRVRFGAPIPPPAGPATARALAEYSERTMRALAAELPPAYRGVYGSE
jgi:1-acyl-sn-glycerol-3-phosphate acyltransferase